MGLLVVTQTPAANPAEPSVPDIADIIPRRTLQGDGLQAGTFTDQTTPTVEQVERIADEFAAEVNAAVPDLPPGLTDQARRVAALGAAAQIELAWFPEDKNGTAKELQARYLDALKRLQEAVTIITGKQEPGENSTGSGGAGGFVATPSGDFPPASLQRVLDEQFPDGLLQPFYRY